jgi:hypothetical protein
MHGGTGSGGQLEIPGILGCNYVADQTSIVWPVSRQHDSFKLTEEEL